MTLLDECIEALSECKIYNGSDGNSLFRNFESLVPFTFYGRIDWKKTTNPISIENKKDLYNFLNGSDLCTILWNDASLPVIQTKLDAIIENIDDVLAVSYDTWLYAEKKNIIIEFYHPRLITLLKIT